MDQVANAPPVSSTKHSKNLLKIFFLMVLLQPFSKNAE